MVAQGAINKCGGVGSFVTQRVWLAGSFLDTGFGYPHLAQNTRVEGVVMCIYFLPFNIRIMDFSLATLNFAESRFNSTDTT